MKSKTRSAAPSKTSRAQSAILPERLVSASATSESLLQEHVSREHARRVGQEGSWRAFALDEKKRGIYGKPMNEIECDAACLAFNALFPAGARHFACPEEMACALAAALALGACVKTHPDVFQSLDKAQIAWEQKNKGRAQAKAQKLISQFSPIENFVRQVRAHDDP